MDYRRLGNSGAIVTAWCLGTMTFGSEADEATSFAIMALEPVVASLDDAPNPELKDFTLRLIVSAVLSVPILLLAMGSMAYGLGAGGEAGVARALEIVRKETDTSMALMGERDIRNIGLHNIYSNDLDRRQGY